MTKVRTRDLALVAVAGGLLAFELVSIGEALPHVKQALVQRGLSTMVTTLSARAADIAGAPLAASAASATTASRPAIGTATVRVHRAAVAKSADAAKRCRAAARAASAERGVGLLRVVTVGSDGSCATHLMVTPSGKSGDVGKALDLALKHATL